VVPRPVGLLVQQGAEAGLEEGHGNLGLQLYAKHARKLALLYKE
jgi:hypothetical protein